MKFCGYSVTSSQSAPARVKPLILPAIIDKEMWEAVQLEMERRRNFALQYGIQKLEYAITSNPFAGRVIFGSCGQIFGRKVWNSTDEKLRRIIWR